MELYGRLATNSDCTRVSFTDITRRLTTRTHCLYSLARRFTYRACSFVLKTYKEEKKRNLKIPQITQRTDSRKKMYYNYR